MFITTVLEHMISLKWGPISKGRGWLGQDNLLWPQFLM